jgi:serine/threonine protein kinase
MSLDELYSDNYIEGSCFLKIPSDHHILLQLASGLDYIHTKGLIHCNINPKNVLFVSGNRVKWANQLGLKMEMTPEMLDWTAPEILIRKDNFYYRHCDTFSDIFSTGCVFFFFLSKGVHLFAGEIGTNEIVKNILQSKKMYLKGKIVATLTNFFVHFTHHLYAIIKWLYLNFC